MNRNLLKLTFLASLLLARTVPSAEAEIVYTPVANAGNYTIDMDHDGVTDFTLFPDFIVGSCNLWAVSVIPSGSNAVVDFRMPPFYTFAIALPSGIMVDSQLPFLAQISTLAELYWGSACEAGGELGEWLGLHDRYVGLRFTGADGAIHFGWAQVTTEAYIDQLGYLNSTTMLSGFAFETIPGQGIRTGQTVE